MCRYHGGSAPQVRLSARQRLAELAEPAVEALRRALQGDDIRAITRAAVAVLDRTGHGPGQHVSIAVEVEAQAHVLADVLRQALTELGVDHRATGVRRAVGGALRRVAAEREHEPGAGEVRAE